MAIERGFWLETHFKHTITDNGPFEFHLPDDPSYIDLAKRKLYFHGNFNCQNNGSNVDTDGSVGPINALGKTLFKQVKIYLKNKLCLDSVTLIHKTSWFVKKVD